MLALFKRNDISPLFGLLFITFILKLKVILHPPSINSLESIHEGFFFSWNSLKSFYTVHPNIYVFLSILLLIGFSFYLNFVINQEKIFPRKSFIPALSFILFTSWNDQINIFSPIFLANSFIFIAFAQALKLYNHHNARKACFDIGLLISLATLFYFPAIILIILYLLLIILLRPFQLQEIIAYLIGCITLMYIAFGFEYIFGNLPKKIHHLNFHFSLPLKIIEPNGNIVAGIISIMIIVYGMFLINQSGGGSTMAVRKKWNAVIFYAIFGMIAGLFSYYFPGITWLIAVTPFSILLSQALQNNREKFNTFTFYFLLLFILITQWFIH